ncbi:hypothetical protein Rta_20600 [Ramlibacter tataouinensis TTB310]|uniref:Uncharacterized protein n=1 Tax=Ramlibacter tataouinensis (strain ATCC BAA-407 / DSM 14655 / LMG 21543 / TTB310) TaxID=365046 RepID=F5XYH7_RAMTT|nr:hypothetical protein Rta_20600 [Ramlibacter tataouinensis TTB310]
MHNPRVFLPPRLRALLAAIDGRADPRQYGAGSWSPAEVHSMLDALMKAGYVVLGEGGTAPANVPAVPRRAAAAPTLVPAGTVPAAPPRFAGAELPDALAVISEFAMAHLPGDALQLLFALEGVTSLAELRTQLGGYEARVAQLGPVGRKHLAELHGLLSGAHPVLQPAF